MSTTYQCHHDGETHHTYAEISHFYCGCDGTTHIACKSRLAPRGTPRPADWPVYLSWRTDASLVHRDGSDHPTSGRGRPGPDVR